MKENGTVYGASYLIDAALYYIDSELKRIMWNIHQKEYESPFENHGNSFVCPEFEVYAYSWEDDEQPYNFKWKEVEVNWYKHLGCGMTTNLPITPERIDEMLTDCIVYLREFEHEEYRKRS